ncbi:DNA-binding response regulator, NarL/FixJ family, contains REC and HTH domains [Algoriella xinjiangensis]|uniref:DNA-binding response regulator, NarL/FixJ family, contains REC and HTH domains n=1 Tax=Algoriella xinjiangensis TaxID=684065 RepID=A0A1I4SDP9_9FLAO|nr:MULTISPECIES: response regulator transcription factor [Algoriella]MBO6211307.1 response regulator transcription factor [Algoriella sp.]SFM62484.1 DNA-binding response regulator, NarL/FixJ family, contains REC and HTH domains [Algoriella xinjiangensis]VDH16015.1 Transcriptional regulatory protein uhpA [Algoriella xinjiangensis]
MIKIGITDDHPLLLEGLKNILSNQPTINTVECYSSAKALQDALTTVEIDILLLDINLDNTNSIELIKPLKKKYPEMHIIMLSVHNEYAVINSCLEEGASGYIQKNASVDEIVEGINSIFDGKIFLCSQTKSVMNKKEKDGLNTIPKLTRREKEILAEAALGLTTQQIADKLFISTHTVDSHRKNLIEKFKTSNLSSAITLAIEYGLVTK